MNATYGDGRAALKTFFFGHRNSIISSRCVQKRRIDRTNWLVCTSCARRFISWPREMVRKLSSTTFDQARQCRLSSSIVCAIFAQLFGQVTVNEWGSSRNIEHVVCNSQISLTFVTHWAALFSLYGMDLCSIQIVGQCLQNNEIQSWQIELL